MSQSEVARKAPPMVPVVSKKAPPKAPPPALQKQLAMAHLRAAEFVMPDDSASMVGSTTGSAASWTKVQRLQ